MGLTDEVRRHAEEIARSAVHVRIDAERLAEYDPGLPEDGSAPEPTLDPVRHYLEGPPAQVARYMLVLDTINFGSGWFPTLRKRVDPAVGRAVSGYNTIAWNLADHWRAGHAWSNEELRAMRTEQIAAALGQPPDHELMSLYAQALRDLGRWLGDRDALDVVAQAKRSAERLAEMLVDGMALYNDRGFYKRAQIAPYDLSLAGVAEFDDLDRLTIFADNLVPHVLRCDGVLVYDDALAADIDAGRLLEPGRREQEIRGCAVHACELLSRRLGVPARIIDTLLWNRGQQPEYKARPRHRCRSVYY
jgi:hypothetical protein